MTTTLQKHGDANALILDQALLDALGITPETPLQVTVRGNSLVVTPANVGLEREKVAASIEKLRPRYTQMLKNLAE